MQPRHLAPHCLLLALAVAPAGAQTVHEFEGTQLSMAWPAGLGGPGAFGRCVAARLTPDEVPDVVLLDGDVPVVLLDADPHWAPLELTVAADDVDRLPSVGPGGRDALALVGASGAWLVSCDPETYQFTSSLLASGPWAGAKLVRVADLDGDGLDDLVGLQGDGVSFSTLLGQGDGSSFQAGSPFASSWNVRDVCPLQWDTDAALELAVLSDWGVEVLESDGSVVDAWQAILPGDAIARLRQAGQATDRIAWITAWAPPAEQWLMTLAPGGAVQDQVDLGALDAFAMVGGDYDLDGDDDLLVSHHFSNELMWFENQRSPADPLGPSFTNSNQEVSLFRVGPPGSGATLNQAWPVMEDLDGDGDLDVFYAAETSATVDILRGEPLAEEDQKTGVLAAEWDVTDVGNPGHLRLQLTSPASVPSAATHLAVDVWWRPTLADDVQPQGVVHQQLALPSSWPHELDLVLPQTELGFLGIYAVEVRAIEVDAGGQSVAASPAYGALFAMDAATLAVLAAEPDTESSLTVIGLSPAPGPTLNGALFKKKSINPFQQNSAPTPAQ